jgi:selectin
MQFRDTSNFVSCSSFLSSQEDFKKDKGEDLIQILCGREKADSEAGVGVCSLLLAQSEVKPQCMLLVLTNRTGKGTPVQRGWEWIG